MASQQEIYIVGNYKPGDADGLAEFNSQTATLLKNTFRFHFVQFDKEKEKNSYTLEDKDGFSIHVFGTKNLSSYILPTALTTWIKNLPTENIVFHLSHIYNLTNYLIVKQLLKAKIPYLITPHDSFVYSPSYQKEKPFIKRLYRNTFVHFFDKFVLDHSTVVHGLTPQCTDCLTYITKSPVIVVNNQVKDMELTFNQALLKDQVCFIGRFDIFRKGIDRSLKAFQLFKKQNNNSGKINFTLVGPADESAVVERERLCKELDLQIGKDVIFTGKLPVAERNNVLTESKVYLHMARTEGFGLSIAQALSCYKPVIVSKQVPIFDKIVAYKAGFAVNNSEEAAQALADIFALSPADYSEMANNARGCYEQEFHPVVIKPQLINLYERALSDKAGRQNSSVEFINQVTNPVSKN